jgi:hypothetical protein
VKLTCFLTDLVQGGNVVVPRTISPLDEIDIQSSLIILREFYGRDVLTMPGDAPAFHVEAGAWAAKYVFYVSQLILLRDMDEDVMQGYLSPFEGEHSAEATYSADLLLRFLPDLFRLGSGLSPGDPLVANLMQTALSWPYSSIGLKDAAAPIPPEVLNNSSLKLAYIDRVIVKKDTGRLRGADEKELLKEVLGDHRQLLWPGLELLNI